jgi:hypothetical protein
MGRKAQGEREAQGGRERGRKEGVGKKGRKAEGRRE